MLKHSSIMASVSSLAELVAGSEATSSSTRELYLAHLPASAFELSFELAMLCLGGAIGFAQTATLFDAAARRRPDGTLNFEPTGHGNFPPGAVQEFAPTVGGDDKGLRDVAPFTPFLNAESTL